MIMLHYNVMKKLFLMIFLCIVTGCTAQTGSLADSTAVSAPVDTVKTTYDDGRVSRVYTVLKGTDVREGVSLTYHPNGKLAVEAPYKNGKLDGVLRSYDENGKLCETVGYKDGIEEGLSIVYYENGKKKSSEKYNRGTLNGMSEDWYEDGKIRRQIPYENGQIHGIVKIYDEMGLLFEDMKFERGIRNGAYHRYSFGKLVQEAEFKDNRCVKNCDF